MTLIGDIADVKGGKRLPKGKLVQDKSTQYRYIRVTDFSKNGVNVDSVKYIDAETQSKVSRYTISDSDVYISIAGTIGLVGMVPKILDGANLTENAAKICNIDSSYVPKYISYFLKSKQGKHEIKSRIVGTSQPKLALFRIKDIPLPNIDKVEQQKIASILGVYDDLIDNNAKRIRILEKMSMLVYAHYFEQSETVDWETTKFKEVIDLRYGKSLTKAARKKGEYPVYGSSGQVGTHNESLVKGPGIILGRKGNVGSVFWSEKSFYPIDTVYYIKSAYPLPYLYYYLERQKFINNDTAVPGLSRNQANLIDFFIPPENLVERFNLYAKSILKMINILKNRNHILYKTRNLLLSHLVSTETER